MDDIERRRGRSLPHWIKPRGTYFLTFRAADSLPAPVVRELREEFEADVLLLTRTLGREPEETEIRPLRTERYRRAEKHLDQGYGECHLRDPRFARLTAEALRFFDGDRYCLHTWCVMPNHVHVLLTMCGEWSPLEVQGSWKKFAGRRINAALGRRGEFWQEEGFDHLVRGPNSFERIRHYIQENPAKAGLVDWPWTSGDGSVPPDW